MTLWATWGPTKGRWGQNSKMPSGRLAGAAGGGSADGKGDARKWPKIGIMSPEKLVVQIDATTCSHGQRRGPDGRGQLYQGKLVDRRLYGTRYSAAARNRKKKPEVHLP